jgi:hypothetical protein
MELLLNLCWLTLLLPAYTLWRQRISSSRSARGSLIFVCTLGCVLVLLFPVISASDDLHAIGQAMEESKHSLRHGGHCACSLHSVTHSSQLALPASASAKVAFEQIGTVLSFSPYSLATFFASRPNGRAPPAERPISL